MPSPSAAQVRQEEMYSALKRWQFEGRPSSARWQTIWSSRASYAANVVNTAVPWGLETYTQRRAQLGNNPGVGFNKVLNQWETDLNTALPASSGSSDLGRTFYALLTSTATAERYDRTDRYVYLEILVSWLNAARLTT